MILGWGFCAPSDHGSMPQRHIHPEEANKYEALLGSFRFSAVWFVVT